MSRRLVSRAIRDAWQGLPKQASFTREELKRRVNDCTGADRLPKERSTQQAVNLKAILGATGETAANLPARMELATFRFQDVIHNFLGGLNPFDNKTRVYKGSGQDAALNKGVERFTGTAKARDLLAYDSDLSGTIIIPTITLHAKFDPVVNFRAQAYYRAIVERAGQSHMLMPLLTSEDQHSKLSESEYLTVLATMADWLDREQRPALSNIRQKCAGYAESSGQPCLLIVAKDN